MDEANMIDNKHTGASGGYNTFNKGMIQDSSENNQPEGSYRFGLNGVKGTLYGDRNNRANEPGTTECWELPAGFFSIGDWYFSGGYHAVFAVNPDTGESIIGKGKQDCTFETVVRSKCLNFSIEHQIQATGRVRLGCEDTVYFTDDLNEVRYFNFNDTKSFYSEEAIEYIHSGKDISTFTGEQWDCSKFGLFREYTVGCISDVRVLQGGELLSGSYNFAVRWLDSDFNPTAWFPTSATINVYRDYSTNATYDKTFGSTNVETDPIGGTIHSGKAVELTRGGSDNRFEYWQVAVIGATSFTGEITEVMYSPVIPMDTEVYRVDGDFNDWEIGSLEELRIPPADIQKAKVVTQLENRLILAGMRGKDYDICGFQRSASKICTKYIVQEVDIDDINSVGDAKNPNTLFTYGSHQGDEVVANGIVYVFDDGTETPVYHIPGPPSDSIPCLGETVEKTKDRYCLMLWMPAALWDKTATVTYKINDVTYTEVHSIPKPPAGQIAVVELHCEDWEFEWELVSVFSGEEYKDKTITTIRKDLVGTGEFFTENCSHINENRQILSEPGALDGWDTKVIENWDISLGPLVPKQDENNVPYAEWDDSRKVKRWQVQNTAVKLGNTFGRPGYYECTNEVYPDIRDCDNNSIWGVDACGRPLAGTPIRHSRMPDRTLEPHVAVNSNTFTRTCLFIATVGPQALTVETPITVRYSKNGVNIVKTINIKWVGRYLIDCTDSSDEDIVGISIEGEGDYVFATSVVEDFNDRRVKLRILGFEFDNIEYPHPDIVGHYFVTAIREDADKTVVDAGFMHRLKGAEDNVGFAYYAENAGYPRSGYYFTPEFLVEGKETLGTNLHVQGKFRASSITQECEDIDGAGSVFSNIDTIIDARHLKYGEYIPDADNLVVEDTTIMNAISFEDNYYSNGGDLVNLSLSNRAQIMHTGKDIPYIPEHRDDLQYVYSRRYKDVYCNLYGLVYRRMHNCLLTLGSEQRVFGGDTYITPMSMNNSLMRRIYDSFWDDLLKYLIIAAAAALTVVTLGAAAPVLGAALVGLTITSTLLGAVVGVTAVAIKAIKDRYKSRRYDNLAASNALNKGCSSDFFEDSFISYAHERVQGVYVESQINYALRQEFTGDCGILYRGDSLLEFFKDRTVQLNEETNKYEPKPTVCPEIYWYNPDFSRVDKVRLFLPVPRNFKCCSDCLNEHSNREYWSEQSFQEERTDNYRVFLPGNYKDIEGRTGKIVNVIPYYSKLLTLTEDGLYMSVASIQERVSGEVVTYIGTGNFLSNPERVAIDDELGSVGCQHQWGNIKTKFGVYIADEKENSLYLYGQGVKDIFVGKMKAWAQENFRPFLKEYLEDRGLEYPNLDNHANPDGIGIHMEYDPFFRRLIVTKRDYLPINLEAWPINASPFSEEVQKRLPSSLYKVGRLYYYKGLFFEYDNSQFRKVSFTDARYFINKSFTFSYYPEDDTFGFFHSYIPLYYTRDKNTFYGSVGNKMEKFNTPNMQSYFGKKYPFIIEGIDAKDMATDKYTDYLGFYTQSKLISADGLSDGDKITFDKVVLYNSYQTTGVLNIDIADDEDLLLQSVTEDTDTIFLERRGKDFYINDIWNATKGEQIPLFVKDWGSIQGQYYIDKVPNFNIGAAIDDWQELTPLMDKWIAYRFFFDAKEDTVLILHYVIPCSYRTNL